MLVVRWTAVLALAWFGHRALSGRNPRWRVALWRGAVVGVAGVGAADAGAARADRPGRSRHRARGRRPAGGGACGARRSQTRAPRSPRRSLDDKTPVSLPRCFRFRPAVPRPRLGGSARRCSACGRLGSWCWRPDWRLRGSGLAGSSAARTRRRKRPSSSAVTWPRRSARRPAAWFARPRWRCPVSPASDGPCCCCRHSHWPTTT